MNKQFLSFFWILVITCSLSIGAMNKQYIISKNLPDAVPNKIWENIFLIKNADFFIINCLSQRNYRTILRFRAMKYIANISLVCKKFNCIVRKLLPLYVDKIIKDMGHSGDDSRFIHRVLGMPPVDSVRYDIVENLPYAVPGELWEQIFLLRNKDLATRLPKDIIIGSQMSTKHQAALQWRAMENMMKLSLVCKRFNVIARKFLALYVNEIKTKIDSLGGKDYIAYKSFVHVTEFGEGWSELRSICIAMKADLNTTKYSKMKGETLLTQAIKKGDPNDIHCLLRWGLDAKQPNEYGDMPIDLACRKGLKYEPKWIKSYGGDPHNKYTVVKKDKLLCNQGQYGYAYGGTPKLKKARKAKKHATQNIPVHSSTKTYSIFSRRNIELASAFVVQIAVIGAIAYWLYNRSSEPTDKEKEDNNVDNGNAENGIEDHNSIEIMPKIDGFVEELVF